MQTVASDQVVFCRLHVGFPKIRDTFGGLPPHYIKIYIIKDYRILGSILNEAHPISENYHV